MNLALIMCNNVILEASLPHFSKVVYAPVNQGASIILCVASTAKAWHIALAVKQCFIETYRENKC